MSQFNERLVLELTHEIRIHKAARDWEKATEALARLKALHSANWCSTEYAKVLQHAGRFDDALSEINWLLEHSWQQQNGPGWAHLPQSMREVMHWKHLADVHEAAALLCKREKALSLEQQHREQATQLRQAIASGQAKADDDHQKRHVQIGEPFKPVMEAEDYKLDRQATALKKAGDMNGAVAALRKRKALLGLLYDDTKLAKYLQEAGYFDEAMAEIQWLLDTNQARLAQLITSPRVSQNQRLASHARGCGAFHRAAALICKRQGLPEQRKHHEATADKYFAIWERLDPIGEQESEALRASHARTIEERSKAAIQKIKAGREST